MCRKTIVVSAVNVRRGGTLRILRDCLSYLSSLAVAGEYRIVAIVHKRNLVEFSGIEYIEMPGTIKSWIRRLWCEYVTMHRISKELSPVFLWLSLHDTTPRVTVDRQAMYCQTSFPFLKLKKRDILFDYKIVLFGLFTKFAYKINVHKNRFIIVQAEWLKNGLSKMLGVEPAKFIVSPPQEMEGNYPPRDKKNDLYSFVYVAIADCHKNIELICQAAEILEKEIGKNQFEVILTLDGTENRYSAWIKKSWGSIDSIKFIGYLKRDDVYQNYANADCMIFPSRIETWGLPISEFKQTGKPMLLADLPYAHEASEGSRQVSFFDPDNASMLAHQMKLLIKGENGFLKSVSPDRNTYSVNTWKGLFEQLLK